MLKIPENIKIVGMITLGYPDEDPDARPRKTIEEIILKDSWE